MVWWPLTNAELQALFGVLGFGASIALWLGAAPVPTAFVCLGALLVAYICGHLVRLRESTVKVEFVHGGAIGGLGYLPFFSRAKHSLLLMHVDDDIPTDEVQAAYGRLLESGVQLRRILVRAPGQEAAVESWVRAQSHRNLRQVSLGDDSATGACTSFALVDDSVLLLAMPGHGAAETGPMAETFLLRHLLVVKDPVVSAAFREAYEELWRRGVSIRA